MRVFDSAVLALAGMALLAAPAQGFRKCKADAVRVGTVCVDKYEASVWEIPGTNDNKSLIVAVQQGKITSAAFLTTVTQRGVTGDDYGAGCPDTGKDCTDFYALSIPGVKPSTDITWFQAAAACRNAGKRLLTNQEWQMAALGTPDPGVENGTCNVGPPFPQVGNSVNTGSRNLCVSDIGAFDMVGNVEEWVADWGDRPTGSTNATWPAMYGSDRSTIGGDGSDTGGVGTGNFPGALRRGGDVFFDRNTLAGVFAVVTDSPPYNSVYTIGFRCAREP